MSSSFTWYPVTCVSFTGGYSFHEWSPTSASYCFQVNLLCVNPFLSGGLVCVCGGGGLGEWFALVGCGEVPVGEKIFIEFACCWSETSLSIWVFYRHFSYIMLRWIICLVSMWTNTRWERVNCNLKTDP